MSSFTHLHVHSEYSLLDGACRIKDLVSAVRDLGMDSVAVTDHGVMYGLVDFYKEAKKQGVRPILGCEFYVAAGSMSDRSGGRGDMYHLVVLAKNNKGYSNLVKLDSAAFTEGFYYKPRIDFELLKQHSEGLIVLSACLGGEVQRLLLENRYEDAVGAALRYREVFGDDYYIELQDQGLREEREILPLQYRLIRETGIAPVATNDVHYIRREDAASQDILMCMQTGAHISDEKRMRFETDQFYLKSADEMAALFRQMPEAIANTQRIAEMCEVDLEFGRYHLPHFHVDEKDGTHEEYLEHIARKGLAERYDTLTEEIEERFRYELATIRDMGFTDYFLIVWDFVNYAKTHGIFVGPGRGSAAGSLVAYCLGITNIDPLRYNLLFERFLNPERVTMPDIDIDFCFERRHEVIDYVTRKYGSDKVAQIVTFGTMGAKMAVRDVARVLELPASEGNRISGLIPSELNMTISRALEENPKLRMEYEQNQHVRRVIDTAQRLEGMPRHTSTHAAGVVISKDPMTDYVPLHRSASDDSVSTQYGKNQIEDLGMLKMDFLGLRTLTVLRDTLDMVEARRGIRLDLDRIDMDDPAIYKMMADGDTVGVFQFESPGMRKLLKDMQPGSLDDLMAANALFRPGPMDSIPDYIANKRRNGAVTYAHPALKPILEDTYGCMVYQEQIMRIVRDLAGYSMARSDLVRRAMSKKKHDVLENERRIFLYGSHEDGLDVDGAIRRGMSEQDASDLFDQMLAFANYAFNKSHACAYSVIAYWTAYLKYYYTQEFVTALFNSFINDKTRFSAYLSAFRRAGLRILPPDVNRSQARFSPDEDGVRFGLGAVAQVGPGIEEAVRRRNVPYTSFHDFVDRNADILNSKGLENLILAGAFDSMGYTRSQLLEVYEQVLRGAVKVNRVKASGQLTLFDQAPDAAGCPLPDCPEMPAAQKLAAEKQVTGLYLSGHPLEDYAEDLRAHSPGIAAALDHAEEHAGRIQVRVTGIISEISVKITKKKQQMASLTLEDLDSQVGVTVFPSLYAETEEMLRADRIIEVTGHMAPDTGRGPEILADSVRPYVPARRKDREICLRLPADRRSALPEVRDILMQHPGPLCIILRDEASGQAYRLKGALAVRYSDELVRQLRGCLGSDNVTVR